MAAVPGHVAAGEGDVIALPAVNRDIALRLHAHPVQEGVVLRADLFKNLLAIIYQVHLVDQHDNLFDSQHPQQVTVAARVFLDAFVGVDHQQGGFGPRSAGDHVFEKFNVARRIVDQIAALAGFEEYPR